MTPYDAGYAAYREGALRIFDYDNERIRQNRNDWLRGYDAAQESFVRAQSWWNSLSESARRYWLTKADPRGDASVEEAWRCYLDSQRELDSLMERERERVGG